MQDLNFAPAPTAAISFDTTLGDWAVLQREPSKAAVYGKLLSPSAGDKVDVTVSGAGFSAYSIPATLDGDTWKVLLQPTKTGGEYSITAILNGNTTSAAVISNVTFGDVWYDYADF
jgi:hypothetical protein